MDPMYKGLFFILIASIIGAFATLNFKKGSAEKISIYNKHLIKAVSLSVFSFTFYIYALQTAPLTFIYLTASISYIWTILLAKYALGEDINQFKKVGIFLIVFGIIVMNL
ncbi:EamA family transporter [archaeon]|jgi:drug/metabolite transporter (DMT)-like permease|nr:EamA family transporter [archaeon]MBT6762388.1 EamA family transporter [archaeon]